MDYSALGFSELVHLVQVLEEKLIEAHVELGCTRGDAQGVVEAIIMQNT